MYNLESKSVTKRPAEQDDFRVKFKTELCENFITTGTCLYGSRCTFAHGMSELRKKTHVGEKYKTKMCIRFSADGSCPYGSRCHFIHQEAFNLEKFSQGIIGMLEENAFLQTGPQSTHSPISSEMDLSPKKEKEQVWNALLQQNKLPGREKSDYYPPLHIQPYTEEYPLAKDNIEGTKLIDKQKNTRVNLKEKGKNDHCNHLHDTAWDITDSLHLYVSQSTDVRSPTYVAEEGKITKTLYPMPSNEEVLLSPNESSLWTNASFRFSWPDFSSDTTTTQKGHSYTTTGDDHDLLLWELRAIGDGIPLFPSQQN